MAGRLTRCLRECSREIGLAGKAERQRDVHQRPIAVHQQGFRALEALGADITMGRFSDGLPEGSRKMESAEARNRCQALYAEIAFQVRFYVVQHSRQSAPIETLNGAGRKGLSGRCGDILLNEPRGQTGCEGSYEQTAGGGFIL